MANPFTVNTATSSPLFQMGLGAVTNAISQNRQQQQQMDTRSQVIDLLNQSRSAETPEDQQRLFLDAFSKDPNLVRGYMNEIRSNAKSVGGNLQKGTTDIIKDSEGNLFYATQQVSPQGQSQTTYSPIGSGPSEPVGKSELVGEYGMTATEKLKQVENAAGAAERGKLKAKNRSEYIKQGSVAKSMIPKTKKMLELNKVIRTGGIAAAQKKITDLFGVTAADVGQFNALAGNLLLDNIKALGSNPTEGERAFLEKITPSVSQGGAVNEAVLNDMLEVQKRQVERAKWFRENPNAGIGEYLDKFGDFKPAENNSQSDTSQLSDDELLKLYGG